MTPLVLEIYLSVKEIIEADVAEVIVMGLTPVKASERLL